MVHSSPIHSGEFFHGPFEITDYDVPFIIVVSNGTTRHLDERALAFAKKFSDQLLVIDEKEFDFGTVPADVQEYYAYQILGSVIRVFVKHTPTTPATTLASVAICGRWSTRLITPH